MDYQPSPQYNLKSIVQRSRNIANQLSGGIKHLLSKNNVTIIDGFASLQPGEATPEVHVEGKIHKAKHVILATGARARTIPQAGLEPDGKYIWSAKEANGS
jgi:dihydrolipoamide dehydrogenase